MLARGGYRLIEKDEAYFAGKLRKQLLLEAGQDGIPRCARWGDERLVAADRAVPGCLVLQMREEIAVAIDVWTLVSAPLARSPVVCVRLCPSLECLFCVAQEGNHLVQGDIGPWLGDSPGLDGGCGVGGGRGRPVAHTRGGREGGRSGGSARGGGAAGQGTEGKQGGHGRLSGGKAGGIGDMPGTEGVAAGKGGGAAERQVAEGTEQRSAQLGMGRTPNHSLRGLGLFVWRRPALHPGERKGRTHLERERDSQKNHADPPLTCFHYVIIPPSHSPPWPPLATPTLPPPSPRPPASSCPGSALLRTRWPATPHWSGSAFPSPLTSSTTSSRSMATRCMPSRSGPSVSSPSTPKLYPLLQDRPTQSPHHRPQRLHRRSVPQGLSIPHPKAFRTFISAQITVAALAPSASLSDKDAAAHWQQALLHLRRDGSARPKQACLFPF